MRFVLFATAGHVDHGKTTLIKTLTGIDTDRLPEEKRRGLSIDIGFAYMDFPEERLRVELIDVPGHERFIKNSIAGLSSASGVLLVVDAGEGVMPQTVEHLRVAKAFGIERGVAVLTKIDRVERELLEIAREELEEFLKREGMEIPILNVSALTGEGIEELKEAIKREALESLSFREDRPLRVLIDSAFSVKGYGTVLRGSCIEGAVREGDRVVVEPTGSLSRVRRIQNHGEFVKEAIAGERVALNLPDIDHREVERGFWVLKPDTYVKTKALIVRSDRERKNGRVYYLFFGMREVRGRFSRVEDDVYILRLEEEVVARRNDRVVVLDSSGSFEGGCEVLHPKARALKKRFIKGNLGLLKESFELFLLKETGLEGFTGKDFRSMTGEAPDVKTLQREALKVGDRFFSKDIFKRLEEKVRDFVSSRLKAGSFGVPRAELLERFGIGPELLEYVIERVPELTLAGEFVVDAKRSRLEDSPDYRRLADLLREGIREEREILSEGVPLDVLNLSVKRRLVHRLGEFLIISDELLKKYVEKLRELGDSFDVQSAKSLLGLSRKYLIPLLEYLDYMGYTRREGNVRVWRSKR